MRPPRKAAGKACLVIFPENLDALLSALRGRHAGDAIRAIDGWAEDFCDMLNNDNMRTLTTWCRDEVLLHVHGGRFEHAMALIERYRAQPLCVFKGTGDLAELPPPSRHGSTVIPFRRPL